jgi:uncharacterized protein YdhG (YjbR/CyaY superfamily)
MTSKAATVDEYMEEVPGGRRAALERLRKLCLRLLDGYEEGMAYGMPVYQRAGTTAGIAFNSQKQYISLYCTNEPVMDEFRTQFPGVSIGKCCIRFTKPEKIDFAVVERLLRRTAESGASGC